MIKFKAFLQKGVVFFGNHLATVGTCCLPLSGGPKEYFSWFSPADLQ
jgi:hypothetical protein